MVARVGRYGRTTIPRDIRRFLGLHDGDRVAFVRRGDEIVVVPLTATLSELRGSVSVPGPQDFESIRLHTVDGVVDGVVGDGA